MSDPFFVQTTYRGAFSPVNQWLSGWTALDALGFVGNTAVAPYLATAPVNQTVTAGGTAMLTLAVEGSTPLSFQWYKGSTVVSSGTTRTLTLSNAVESDEGIYTLVSSNSAGVITNQVQLTVDPVVQVGEVVVNQPITGSVTWRANNTYILDGFVYVMNGASLTIEAGTVIKARTGQDSETSALIVTTGGKIFANG